MSKVTIQGDASGTGIFTIASPNSNTDRTLVLPDEAGTVLTTAGVPASAMPAGSVLQVVHHMHDPGSTATTSTTLIDTGLTVTLTPTSASSKFLILASMWEVYVPDAYKAVGLAINRNGTVIGDHSGATIGYQSSTSNFFNVNMQYFDSPNTTSPLTYKIQFKSFYGTSVSVHSDNTASYLTVMEIAG